MSYDNAITDYWLEHYATEHCTLCGNSGVIDTTGLQTPAGVTVGRENFCICPNGQSMREHGAVVGVVHEIRSQPEQGTQWCDCEPGECVGGEIMRCRVNSPLLEQSRSEE